MTRGFSGYHPIINFLWFVEVIGFTMFFMNPVCLAVSLTGSLCYYVRLRGAAALRFCIRGVLPVMLIAALVNPAFNHEGATILCYLPGGNPLTLESIYYGLAAAVMLSASILWFGCYSEIMTSDKFIYLFGRVIPALSLVLSMTLRFVPRFATQLKSASDAQTCIGRGIHDGKPRERLKNALNLLSSLISWSMESAVSTADSMKSRGWGLPHRTAFSIYRFEDRDKSMLAWLIVGGIYVLSSAIAGGFDWRYFPTVNGGEQNIFTVSFFAVYLALCLTPTIIELRENRASSDKTQPDNIGHCVQD